MIAATEPFVPDSFREIAELLQARHISPPPIIGIMSLKHADEATMLFR